MRRGTSRLSLLLAAVPALAAADPAPAPEAAVPPPPSGPEERLDLRPRIYVGDLPQLAALVRQDTSLTARADELRGRDTAATVLGGAALASILVLPLASLSDVSCEDVGMGLQQCSPRPRLAIAGLVGGAVLIIVAAAVAPSRGEVLDLLSRWNLRHPDRQLVPDPWLGAAVVALPPEASRPPLLPDPPAAPPPR